VSLRRNGSDRATRRDWQGPPSQKLSTIILYGRQTFSMSLRFLRTLPLKTGLFTFNPPGTRRDSCAPRLDPRARRDSRVHDVVEKEVQFSGGCQRSRVSTCEPPIRLWTLCRARLRIIHSPFSQFRRFNMVDFFYRTHYLSEIYASPFPRLPREKNERNFARSGHVRFRAGRDHTPHMRQTSRRVSQNSL
jgi:hypothetical protein